MASTWLISPWTGWLNKGKETNKIEIIMYGLRHNTYSIMEFVGFWNGFATDKSGRDFFVVLFLYSIWSKKPEN